MFNDGQRHVKWKPIHVIEQQQQQQQHEQQQRASLSDHQRNEERWAMQPGADEQLSAHNNLVDIAIDQDQATAQSKEVTALKCVIGCQRPSANATASTKSIECVGARFPVAKRSQRTAGEGEAGASVYHLQPWLLEQEQHQSSLADAHRRETLPL